MTQADALSAHPSAIADSLSVMSQQLLQSVNQTESSENNRDDLHIATLAGICAAQRQLEQSLPNDAHAGTSQHFGVLERRHILDMLLKDSQAAAWGMASSIDRNTMASAPEYCRKEPTLDSIQRTLALAHRLSYTSFAPPGFQPGVTQLHAFRPPAPQEWQMRSAHLHQFAEEVRQRALQQQLPSVIGSADQIGAPPAAVNDVSAAHVPRPALVSSLPQDPDIIQDVSPADEDSVPPNAAARVARPVVEASFLDLNADLGMQVSEEETSEDFSDDSD